MRTYVGARIQMKVRSIFLAWYMKFRELKILSYSVISDLDLDLEHRDLNEDALCVSEALPI